jgi:Putative prokaryotic signal transducing protein
MPGDDANADWIELERFTDPIHAEMIRDFLSEHDVRVAIRGNPHATRMTWSQTSEVLRVVVAPSDVEKAREALEAMTAEGTHPFRGASPIDDDAEKAEQFVKPRSMIGAAVLAVIVPIGGGHFYARHGAAGTILCAGMVSAVLGMLFGGPAVLTRTWALLVAIDMVGALWAVRRFNEKRVPSESVQRRWALGAVALAFATTWLSANH